MIAIISENGLSKLVELWNHSPNNGHLYFGFQPPFVKRNLNQPYQLLHPGRCSYTWNHHAETTYDTQWDGEWGIGDARIMILI